MGKYAQLVLGPAGCGKSTYCYFMYQHLRLCKRTAHVINLDPAAEEFKYPVSVDIRDLIDVETVMKGKKLGPNGSLVYCMEYMMDHEDWLRENLEGYDDEYLLFDLPGQIELYTHMPTIKRFASLLRDFLGYNVCVLFLLDAHFITDASKFVSAALSSLSVMIHLEMPHLNILTKCDLLDGKQGLDVFLDLDTRSLEYMLDSEALQSQAVLNGDTLTGSSNSSVSISSSSSQYLSSALSTDVPPRHRNPFSNPDMDAEEISGGTGSDRLAKWKTDLKDGDAEGRGMVKESELSSSATLAASSSRFSSSPSTSPSSSPSSSLPAFSPTLVSPFSPLKHSPLHRLNTLLCRILDDFNLVSFVPLDVTREDSIEKLLLMVDSALQFGEDEEPKEPTDRDDD